MEYEERTNDNPSFGAVGKLVKPTDFHSVVT